MARPKKKKFGNELDEPLNPNLYRYGGLGGPKTKEEALSKFAKDRREKLFLLLEYYNLDKNNPGCWYMLSLILATEYIDGFKIGKPPTLKKVQSMESYIFYMVILEIMKSNKLSIDNAIKYFQKEVNDKLEDGIDFRSDLSREFQQIKNENFLISMIENMSSKFYANKFEILKKSFPNYKETAFLYAIKYVKKIKLNDFME